jgi:hypothetical protein
MDIRLVSIDDVPVFRRARQPFIARPTASANTELPDIVRGLPSDMALEIVCENATEAQGVEAVLISRVPEASIHVNEETVYVSYRLLGLIATPRGMGGGGG